MESLSGVLWFIIIGALFYWMMKKGGCGGGGHGHGGGHGGGEGTGHSQGGDPSAGRKHGQDTDKKQGCH